MSDEGLHYYAKPEDDSESDDGSQKERRTAVATTRSVYNVIYEADDDDLLSETTSEYLEEIDLPLPVITDSESSRWSRFGQCCECCDTCIRKHAWIGKYHCGWVKNGLYYILLNVCVLFMFCSVMYLTQVNYNKSPEVPPYQQLKYKTNHHPGVSFVPSMVNLGYTPVSVIWYGHSGNDTYANRRKSTYVKAIDDLIYANKRACNFAFRCEYDATSWGECESSDYGYSEDKPCIFLKLNRLSMWLPEEYDEKSNIPDDVPQELVSEIDVKSPRIWIHCEGESDYDKEKIGKVSYFPGPFFNSSHFPVSNQVETNPIITIKLNKYKSGYVAKLICGLYAKNVHSPVAHYAFIYIRNK